MPPSSRGAAGWAGSSNASRTDCAAGFSGLLKKASVKRQDPRTPGTESLESWNPGVPGAGRLDQVGAHPPPAGTAGSVQLHVAAGAVLLGLPVEEPRVELRGSREVRAFELDMDDLDGHGATLSDSAGRGQCAVVAASRP